MRVLEGETTAAGNDSPEITQLKRSEGARKGVFTYKNVSHFLNQEIRRFRKRKERESRKAAAAAAAGAILPSYSYTYPLGLYFFLFFLFLYTILSLFIGMHGWSPGAPSTSNRRERICNAYTTIVVCRSGGCA